MASNRRKQQPKKGNNLATYGMSAGIIVLALIAAYLDPNVKPKLSKYGEKAGQNIKSMYNNVATPIKQKFDEAGKVDNYDKSTLIDLIQESRIVLERDEAAVLSLQKDLNHLLRAQGKSEIKEDGLTGPEFRYALTETPRQDLVKLVKKHIYHEETTEISQTQKAPLTKDSVHTFAIAANHFWKDNVHKQSSQILHFQKKVNEVYGLSVLPETGLFDNRTQRALSELPQDVYTQYFVKDENCQFMVDCYMDLMLRKAQHEQQQQMVENICNDVKKLPSSYRKLCIQAINQYIEQKNPKIDLEVENYCLPKNTMLIIKQRLNTLDQDQLNDIMDITNKAKVLSAEPNVIIKQSQQTKWWRQYE